ncbi:MAG: glycosyltransferase family 4 protein [Deltaproteobacteria bacterium]|nr:glycosyltransferase family 4 protein [Deltaproteobacteria bacterium]
MAAQRKLRVAWFSALDFDGETRSLSAYVSTLLLPLLSQSFEIELFCDSFGRYQEFPTHHYLTAYKRHAECPFDLFFYQLEDCKCADFVRIHLGLIPGIVWFHDFALRTDGPEQILGSPWQETVAKFEAISKPDSKPPRGTEFFRESPLALREASYAAVALFSNPAAHAQYRQSVKLSLRAADTPSFYLPFPVQFFGGTAANRNGVGRIIFCGSTGLEGRAHKVLEALAGFGTGVKLYWLLDAEERGRAEALVRECEASQVEILEGRTPKRWQSLAAHADLAIHSHFSVFGGLGPYLEISLANGVPCVVTDRVTDFAAADYLPEHLVMRVSPGRSEALELKALLRAALSQEICIDREQIRSFALETFDHRVVALELGQVFERETPQLKSLMENWRLLEQEASLALIEEVGASSATSSTISSANEVAAAFDPWQQVYQPVFKELGWK